MAGWAVVGDVAAMAGRGEGWRRWKWALAIACLARRFNGKDLAQPWLDRPWGGRRPESRPTGGGCLALRIITARGFFLFADQGRVCHIKCHASVSMPAMWRGKLTISQGPPLSSLFSLPPLDYSRCVCVPGRGPLVSRRPILRSGEDSLKQLVIDCHHCDATYYLVPTLGTQPPPLSSTRSTTDCPTCPASFLPTTQETR